MTFRKEATTAAYRLPMNMLADILGLPKRTCNWTLKVSMDGSAIIETTEILCGDDGKPIICNNSVEHVNRVYGLEATSSCFNLNLLSQKEVAK